MSQPKRLYLARWEARAESKSSLHHTHGEFRCRPKFDFCSFLCSCSNPQRRVIAYAMQFISVCLKVFIGITMFYFPCYLNNTLLIENGVSTTRWIISIFWLFLHWFFWLIKNCLSVEITPPNLCIHLNEIRHGDTINRDTKFSPGRLNYSDKRLVIIPSHS